MSFLHIFLPTLHRCRRRHSTTSSVSSYFVSLGSPKPLHEQRMCHLPRQGLIFIPSPPPNKHPGLRLVCGGCDGSTTEQANERTNERKDGMWRHQHPLAFVFLHLSDSTVSCILRLSVYTRNETELEQLAGYRGDEVLLSGQQITHVKRLRAGRNGTRGSY